MTTAPSCSREAWGTLPDGTPVTRWTLTGGGTTASVLSYGATLQSLRLPDRHGVDDEVTFGFDSLEPYTGEHPYFGAVIGRFANRITAGRLRLNGREYALALTDGPNHLHGGPDGFDRRVWDPVDPDGESLDGGVGVRLRLVSPDGDQGYPAALAVQVLYAVTTDGALTLEYEARNLEEPGGPSTVVNLTNHAYVNLAGDGSGTVEGHLLTVDASRYLPVDATSMPLGDPAPVAGTPFDFRTPTAIGARLREGHQQLVNVQGYDHTWVLDGDPSTVRRAGALEHPGSGRRLEVFTDQPGLQLYTGNKLDGRIVGRSGRTYRSGDAICLETQHFPDSPNHPQYPTTALAPGEVLRSVTRFVPSVV